MAKRDKQHARLEAVGAIEPVEVSGAVEAAEAVVELERLEVGGKSGAQVGAVRTARIERARLLLEETRVAARLYGRPFDREVLRLVEAVLEVAAG